MAPLIILIVSFLIVISLDRFLLGRRIEMSLAGRIAMSAMLLATGIAHFTSTEAMVEIMPEFMPMKREMVYFTGVCELAAVIGLLWNRTSRLTSIVLIVFFIAILPANIAGSLKQAGLGGTEYGPVYLLFRIPLQAFFIWWVWYFGIRLTSSARTQ